MLSDRDFSLILARFDLDWEGYCRVRKGVKKRLRRQWIELGLTRVDDFMAALDADPALHEKCRRLLTVSVSRFFRDAGLWTIFGREILPLFSDQQKIRVWSAGCARGEEVYTIKIVHDLWREQTGSVPAIEVLATDLNPLYLEQARAGVYGQGSLREVPEELRTVYFQKLPGKKQYRVAESLKDGVRWLEHDLCSGGSPGRFDLVLMRNNILTYESPDTRAQVLDRVTAGLEPGGFLIIGAKEQLCDQKPELRPWPGLPGVFRRIQSVSSSLN
jgi:chemotaxis protein methyltransferase CheR